MGKNKHLEIYKKAHHNAFELSRESELLFDNGCYARAYALAFTALEEISKSQFAADVYTGFVEVEEFEDFYRDHKDKIGRMRWAHKDANGFYSMKWVGPDKDDMKKMSPKEPTFEKRQRSLYVDLNLDEQDIYTPEEQVTENEAEGIIHIVNTALNRISEVVDFHGRQIGTKGFMK